MWLFIAGLFIGTMVGLLGSLFCLAADKYLDETAGNPIDSDGSMASPELAHANPEASLVALDICTGVTGVEARTH